jgi:hypothetical protein
LGAPRTSKSQGLLTKMTGNVVLVGDLLFHMMEAAQMRANVTNGVTIYP